MESQKHPVGDCPTSQYPSHVASTITGAGAGTPATVVVVVANGVVPDGPGEAVPGAGWAVPSPSSPGRMSSGAGSSAALVVVKLATHQSSAICRHAPRMPCPPTRRWGRGVRPRRRRKYCTDSAPILYVLGVWPPNGATATKITSRSSTQTLKRRHPFVLRCRNATPHASRQMEWQ